MLKFRPSPPPPRAAQPGGTAPGRSLRRGARHAAGTEAAAPGRAAFEGRCFSGRAGPHRVSRSAALFVAARAEASAGGAFGGRPGRGGDMRGARGIHPQVHLRIPCYDFSFLQARGLAALRASGALAAAPSR